MKDQIIYCNDLEAFKVALAEAGYLDEESQSFAVPHSYTPVVKKEISGTTHSLALVRGNVLPLGEVVAEDETVSVPFPMLESLGNYDELFADVDKLAKYKLVYPYDVPLEYTDEDGTVHTYMRPEKIGVFA